ncbi:MAG: NCS2 family permease [Firmicutes bacterium]|jgi:AGZA family xanthine/uracil permease-like MFS transporter|nr:NCS2 family permease [Bacillota bacterium]
MMEQFFKLKEHGTNVKTELLAGATTFITMAYIIFVNPSILASTGMDQAAVATATILSAGITTILMGLFVNYPFALASGMGLNAFFAYVVAASAGWQVALGAVFISGIVFLLISIFGIVDYIDKAVPVSLKKAVAAGIGLFIAFIGLKNAGIIVANEGTLIGLGNLGEPNTMLALIGLGITAILMSLKIKGAILIGILLTTLIGIPMGITKWNGIIGLPASLSPILFKMDLAGAWKLGFFTIFSFLFVDVFDTLGTLMGTAAKADFLDKDGRLPKIKNAMLVDAVGTCLGAALGTSTVTTYVESSAGIAEGGRTGLTAVTVGVLFLLSLFFAPLALTVPGAATAPALVIVGVLMMSAVMGIDFNDFTEAFPAFITLAVMPFSGSIATGIAAGFLAYIVTNLFSGKAKEIHWFMYVLGLIALLHFFG